MTHTEQTIAIRQSPNWWTISAVIVAAIFIFLTFRGCKDKGTVQIVKVVDSALLEENRRMRDSASFYKQYKWKTDILQTQLYETEKTIVSLTGAIQKMEARIRRPVIVTDSANCAELVTQVNAYIDTAVIYRDLWERQGQNYQASIAYEKNYSATLKKLLDSCRAVIGIVEPAIAATKPSGVVSLGVVGMYNPLTFGAGPALMYTDKRGRSFTGNYMVTNGKPAYGGGFFVPIRFRKL